MRAGPGHAHDKALLDPDAYGVELLCPSPGCRWEHAVRVGCAGCVQHAPLAFAVHLVQAHPKFILDVKEKL
jgi:hypothetical protein